MAIKSSALVLLSGGMDSVTLLYYVKKVLGYDVVALGFDYGQKNKIELEYARKSAKGLNVPFSVLKIQMLFGQGVFVPGRNVIFLAYATAFASLKGIQDIFFGPTKDDFREFTDCREEFVRYISSALSKGYGINGIYAPFVHKSKKEVVELGRKLGVLFHLTWSCYTPQKGRPCRKCLACINRANALST